MKERMNEWLTKMMGRQDVGGVTVPPDKHSDWGRFPSEARGRHHRLVMMLVITLPPPK